MSGSTSVDDIVSKFPVKVLPIIQGEPSYKTINELIQLLYSNAASLPSPLGGGKHGHIGLLMKPTLYDTLAPGNPYVTPDDPGITPDMPEGTFTVAYRQKIRDEHKVARLIYVCHCNMDTTLKGQIVDAVDDMYL